MIEMKREAVRPSSKKEIDLKEYFTLLKRKFWIVGLTVLLAVSAGLFLTERNSSAPFYESSTRMVIASSEEDIETLMVMMTDPLMMESIIEELKLNKSPESLASQISVAKVNGSQVVEVRATDIEAETAAEIANASVNVFKREVAEMLNFNNITLLAPAEVNNTPVETGGIGLKVFVLAGILLGVGAVFVLDSLDDTVKKEKEIEEIAGIPVIGKISAFNKSKRSFRKGKEKKIQVRGEAIDTK